jgi:LysM repeat protein
MRRQRAVACCAVVLLVSWASLTMTGCTRSRREGPTPTLAAAAKTPTRLSGPTPTLASTPKPPPTNIVTTTGPTVVRVAEITPSAVAVTPVAALTTATAPAATTGSFEYTVQWYDTLYSLARRFNTSVDAIVTLNGLPDANQIKVGQVLEIPGAGAPSSSGTEYIVQAGDTLYSIARRYGASAEAIGLANGIVNPWLIQVGQKLVIPTGSSVVPSSTGTTYVVQRGDTLSAIAAKFGKNAWDIVVANNLSDPQQIWVGQVLTIP